MVIIDSLYFIYNLCYDFFIYIIIYLIIIYIIVVDVVIILILSNIFSNKSKFIHILTISLQSLQIMLSYDFIGEQPRRGQKNLDSYQRLFGEPERPVTPAKNHMKSNIPFGLNNTKNNNSNNNITNNHGDHSEPSSMMVNNSINNNNKNAVIVNGNGHHYNGGGNKSASSVSSNSSSVSSSTENLKMNGYSKSITTSSSSTVTGKITIASINIYNCY